MPILVKQKRDYADEFDIEGFAIFTPEEWEERKQQIHETSYPDECYFGTNEYIEFRSEKDALSHLVIKKITDEEELLLRKMFDMRDWENTFGIFVLPEF